MVPSQFWQSPSSSFCPLLPAGGNISMRIVNQTPALSFSGPAVFGSGNGCLLSCGFLYCPSEENIFSWQNEKYIFNTASKTYKTVLFRLLGLFWVPAFALTTCVASSHPTPERHRQVHAIYSRCTWARLLCSGECGTSFWHVPVIRKELRGSICSRQLYQFQAADGLATFAFCHISPVQ